jgi:pimeloyl-ACP methyl ester carboxylesterase
VKERPLTFGSHAGLVGVVCEPDSGPAPGVPGFLFFNIGLNHRVGPQRVQVELARALADQGFASLRFDLSGLGDSEARSDGRSEQERAVLDIQEAMDALQKRSGIRTFVLTGLCSGVDGMHAASRVDRRVVGAVHIDGYAYADAGHKRRVRLAKARDLLNQMRWKRFLGRRWRLLLGKAQERDAETAGAEPIFDRTYPPLEDFRGALQEFLGRNMALLFVYSGEAFFFDQQAQFASMLGWNTLPASIEVEYWPECDHIFTTGAMRRKLVDRIVSWGKARRAGWLSSGEGQVS